ncbi:MAG: Rieske (2Fe-2S) protein [Actinobacteria bacterium]|nr:Rieske (2Fe-2S) protein [Actinomycetota bacterium]
MARHNLGPVSGFPLGAARIVEVEGRSIGVVNTGDRFFALRNVCPHQGGPLCRGRVMGWLESERPGAYSYTEGRYLMECPWHGWEFDLETGQSWFDPAKTRVKPYPVTVGGAAEPSAEDAEPSGRQPGPYTAEAYAVAVEEQYVFIEVGR